MKKIYQKPLMEVVNMELQQFCNTSITIGNDYESGTEVLSRHDDFDIWESWE